MKIEITRREYLLLLDMLYMATWVLDAHTLGAPRDSTKPFHALEQKMLRYVAESGIADEWVEWDEDLGEYVHTAMYEEERSVIRYMLEFEEDSFWDEQVDRLSRRDLTEEYGRDLEEVDLYDWYPLYERLAQSYGEEFQRSGLSNLRIH
ncbi:MAG: hypothetical protein R6U70_00145 [Bacillota bacterium]